MIRSASVTSSSVALNAEGGGYRAAALLDGMMHGRQRKPARLTVEALHVVTRRSTDILALDEGIDFMALPPFLTSDSH